jgi:transcriptional regulator with XRE-family HTH domain
MAVLKQKPLLKIRAERHRRGLRLMDLAYMANVPMSELSRIELGNAKPYRAYAERLSKVLGLRPEELQDEEAE